MKQRSLKVALVHDWLTGMRGGERVLDEFAGLFPRAHLYTLVHVPGSVSARIESLDIRASVISRLPGIARHYRKFLPLFPTLIERRYLEGYDLVLSTHHAVAKGIRVAPGTPHLCYCHTPMRYIWDQIDVYLGTGAIRKLATPLVARLRAFDVRTAHEDRVQRFVANSRTVADRIRRIYGREADVIHPPVDLELFQPSLDRPENFFLMVGGFVPYKREAVVIEAFRSLGAGYRLVVAGDGPLRHRLERSAPGNVEFVGRVSDDRLAELYARCRALVFASEEDFGLVPLEAQACGSPVIAYAGGGALETVVGERDVAALGPRPGVFFAQQTADAVVDSIRDFERVETEFDPVAIRRHAERFSASCFRDEILEAIERLLKES